MGVGGSVWVVNALWSMTKIGLMEFYQIISDEENCRRQWQKNDVVHCVIRRLYSPNEMIENYFNTYLKLNKVVYA